MATRRPLQRTFGRKGQDRARDDFREASRVSPAVKKTVHRPALVECSPNVVVKQVVDDDKPQGLKVSSPAVTKKLTSRHNATGSIVKPCDSVTGAVDLVAALQSISLEEKTKTTPAKPSRSIPKTTDTSKKSDVLQGYLDPLLKVDGVDSRIHDFAEWMQARSKRVDISKIGEGSFGEVYRATDDSTSVILKLMPLNARQGRGSRSYTAIADAAREVVLLDFMQQVPGFVEFRGACVLQGQMPGQLVEQWSLFKDSGKTVESKDPNLSTSYPPTQLWLLIEMSDAGKSLEPGQYHPLGDVVPRKGEASLSVRHTWDVFWQIVQALSRAESFCEFEHRDLHPGNVCVLDVRPTANSSQHTVEDERFRLRFTGLQVTLIDYTLSRAVLDDGNVVVYDAVKDKGLTTGQGDAQYDIYRYMVEMLQDDGSTGFRPQTNLLWLYHMLDKMLAVTKIESKAKHKAGKQQPKIDQELLATLKGLKSELDPNRWKSWKLQSSVDLLDMGVEKQWFTVEELMQEE